MCEACRPKPSNGEIQRVTTSARQVRRGSKLPGHPQVGAVHKAIYVRSMDLLVTVKTVLSRVPGHNAYKVAQQTTRRRRACASAHVSRRARRPPSFVFEQARPTCTGFSPASAPSSLCARSSVLLVFAFDLAFSVNLSLHERKDGPDGGWPVFAPTIRAI